MKISVEIARKVEGLPPAQREQVRAIVRRHINACRSLGLEPENMERVWIEAMEAVEIDANYLDNLKEKWPEWEPVRKYEVYEPPKAA